jgi:hypothetical protein
MLDIAACNIQPKAPEFFKHQEKLTQDKAVSRVKLTQSSATLL